MIKIGKVSFDGKFIIIHGPYDYDFTVERFKTDKDLLEWLYHLSEKNWFDREMGNNLIDVYTVIYNKQDSDFINALKWTSAVKKAIAEAERFVKKAKKLEVYTCYDGTKRLNDAEIGVRAAAYKRASMDLTRSLAKLRNS